MQECAIVGILNLTIFLISTFSISRGRRPLKIILKWVYFWGIRCWVNTAPFGAFRKIFPGSQLCPPETPPPPFLPANWPDCNICVLHALKVIELGEAHFLPDLGMDLSSERYFQRGANGSWLWDWFVMLASTCQEWWQIHQLVLF